MTETLWLGLGVLLVGDLLVSAGSPPEAQISDGPLRARLFLPDTIITHSGTIGAIRVSTTSSMKALTSLPVPAPRSRARGKSLWPGGRRSVSMRPDLAGLSSRSASV